ncbi:MAG: PAS domain-containing protein, partial [Armatimonadetes bacterium]|nr:PAS domain-containing protein [Armatimonadota bacterium]
MALEHDRATVVQALVVARDEHRLPGRLTEALQRCCGTEPEVAARPEEALNLLSSRHFDLVLWDVAGPVLPGMPGLREILHRQPQAAVVILADPDDLPLVARALEAGASSYLILGPHLDASLEPVVKSALDAIALRRHLLQARRLASSATARLKLLGELTSDALFFLSPAGKILWANAAVEKVLGRSSEELVGVAATDLFRPARMMEGLLACLRGDDEGSSLSEAGATVLETDDSRVVSGVEVFLRQSDGPFLLVTVAAGGLLDAESKVREIVLVASSVGQEELLSRELAQANRRLEVLLASLAEAVAFLDTQGVVVKANRAFATAVGAAQLDEVLGRSLDELFGGEPRVQDLRQAALRDGEASLGPVQVRWRDGMGQGLTLRVSTIVADDGKPWGQVLVADVRAPQAPPQAGITLSPTPELLTQSLERAKQVLSWDDVPAALQGFLNTVVATVPADAAALVLLGADAPQPLTAQRGLSPEVLSRLVNLATTRLPAAGNALPKPLAIPDLENYLAEADDKPTANMLLSEGLNSCVFLPLSLAGHPLGLLFLASARAGTFTSPRSAELTGLAASLAAALAALTDQIRLRETQVYFEHIGKLVTELATAEGLEAMVQAATRSVVEASGAEWAAAHLLDEGQEELEIAVRADRDGSVSAGAAMPAAAHEAAWKAIEQGRLIVVKSGGDEPLGLAACPIGVGGQVAGAIVAAWSGGGPSEAQEKFLELVGTHTGVAVFNARRFERDDERLSQIAAAAAAATKIERRARELLQAAVAVEELTELDDLLSELAAAARRVVEVDQVSLYLADHEEGQLVGAVIAAEDGSVRPLRESWPLQKGASVHADAALSDNPYLVAPVQTEEGTYDAAFIPLRTQSA